MYVKFKVKNPEKIANQSFRLTGEAYFLAWTTTPWTLPGNVALAVSPKVQYSAVTFDDGQTYIASKEYWNRYQHDLIEGTSTNVQL